MWIRSSQCWVAIRNVEIYQNVLLKTLCNLAVECAENTVAQQLQYQS